MYWIENFGFGGLVFAVLGNCEYLTEGYIYHIGDFWRACRAGEIP